MNSFLKLNSRLSWIFFGILAKIFSAGISRLHSTSVEELIEDFSPIKKKVYGKWTNMFQQVCRKCITLHHWYILTKIFVFHEKLFFLQSFRTSGKNSSSCLQKFLLQVCQSNISCVKWTFEGFNFLTNFKNKFRAFGEKVLVVLSKLLLHLQRNLSSIFEVFEYLIIFV